MIRNILYSLFLHLVLIILIYFNFQPNPIVDVEKNLEVIISFNQDAGNTDKSSKINAETAIKNSKDQVKIISKLPKKDQTQTQTQKLEIKKDKSEIIKSNKIQPPKPSTNELKKKEDNVPKKLVSSTKSTSKAIKNDQKILDKKDNSKQDLKQPNPKEEKPEIEKPKEEKPKEEKPLLENTQEKQKIELPDKVNLEENKTIDDQKESQTKAVESQEESQDKEDIFTQNNIESLDLLSREKFNIQLQIKRCYKEALKEGEQGQMVKVYIFLDKDGFIDPNLAKFQDFAQYQKLHPQGSKAGFENSVAIVKKALKFCSPIRNLPQDKYDIWKEISLEFE